MSMCDSDLDSFYVTTRDQLRATTITRLQIPSSRNVNENHALIVRDDDSCT